MAHQFSLGFCEPRDIHQAVFLFRLGEPFLTALLQGSHFTSNSSP
jgi:hypothetical protein